MRNRWWMGLFVVCACTHTSGSSAVERGEVLIREGRAVEAYEVFADAVCENPGDVSIATRFVEVWHKLGGVGDPLAALSDCPVSEHVVAFIEGMRQAVGGQTEEADVALARAEELSPPEQRAQIVYRRGLVALNAGAADARAQLERAAGMAPARVDVRLALARALVDGEEPEQAVAVLRGILVLDITPEEVNKAGQILASAVEGAEPELNPGIERTLKDILGELEKGAPETTALARAQALAAEVAHPRVFKVAALVALHRGLMDDAVNHLEVAAQLGPLDPEPWRILGMARHAAKRTNDAAVALAQAHARDPFDVEVALLLAETATATGDHKTARDAYAALSKLESNVPDHFLNWARGERRLGRLVEARRAVEAGLALSSSHVSLLFELASIEAHWALAAPTEDERQAARRRTEEAIDHLLDIAPDHPGVAAIQSSLEEKPQ